MAFGPCSHRACVSVPIDDDEQLELTKTYTYRLERTDELDRRIDINTTSGTLTVIDDPTDGKYVTCMHVHDCTRAPLLQRRY